MQSGIFDVQGKQESRGEQANAPGKAHIKAVLLEFFPVLLVPSGNTTRAQNILSWDPAACSQKAQVSSSLSRVQGRQDILILLLAGRPGLHTSCAHPYTRTLPSPGCAGEIHPKVGTDQLPCVPPASCLLCIAFVSLFMTKLESWLPGPWPCWGPCPAPGEGTCQPSPLALMLLQGQQGCAEEEGQSACTPPCAGPLPRGWLTVG